MQLELRSAIATPLAADTLWGHIAWGIRWRDGESALRRWLERYDAGDPPLVLGDPLPAGFFPRPALPPPPRPDVTEVDKADTLKDMAKTEWLSGEVWNAISANLSSVSLWSALTAAYEAAKKNRGNSAGDSAAGPPKILEDAVTHAAINRFTGGTAQPAGGTLFTVEWFWYALPRARFDVWILSPEDPALIRRWFEDGLAGGYGRDGSTGRGHLIVADLVEQTLPAVPGANAVVLLGPAVPRPADPARGFFNFGVRCGRLGGNFAIGPLPDGTTGRQKRPLRCLLRGSTLICNGTPPATVGRIVAGVHDLPQIRHYGIAPALPCRVDDSIIGDALDHACEQTGKAEVSSS